MKVPSLCALGFALSVVVSAGASSQQDKRVPKKPERPFRVFVFTNGLTNEHVDMPRVAEEVAKRIDKKKWLEHAEARDEADVVVEVLTHVVNKQYRTQLSNRVDNTGVGKSWIDDNYVAEWHYIESRVDFKNGQRLVTGTDERQRGGNMKGAASNLAEKLEDYCREHYWELVGTE